MDQHDLNRAVAEATMESVDTIADFGFSLLAMPPTHPLAGMAQRRTYPLRIAPEARKRKRKQPRKRAKLFVTSAPAA